MQCEKNMLTYFKTWFKLDSSAEKAADFSVRGFGPVYIIDITNDSGKCNKRNIQRLHDILPPQVVKWVNVANMGLSTENWFNVFNVGFG